MTEKTATFEKLLSKRVLVFLREPAGFRYRGQLLSVNDSFLTLQDERSGVTILSLDTIRSVEAIQGGGDS